MKFASTLCFRRGPQLPLTVFALALTLVACQEGSKTSAPKSRSDAVLSAAASPVMAKPRASVAPVPSQTAPPKHRRLCANLEDPGITLADSETSQRAAPGTPALPKSIQTGAGKWTWVNLWAAWCVPCKAEIPRLRAWQKKLEGKARFSFVAVDDDERQLQAFLEEQPDTGVKSTYWLREGKQREDWFEQLAMDADPELPAHVIFDDKGNKRCVVLGAVEDSDWPQVESLLSGAQR